MLGFWFSKCWYIVAITVVCAIILTFLLREANTKIKSKERENPVDAGLRDFCIVFYGLAVIVCLVLCVLELLSVTKEYGKTYTMTVDIHYSSSRVVRETFVSENESFDIDYYENEARIWGADGICLQVNAPIEVVDYTVKENDQTKRHENQ